MNKKRIDIMISIAMDILKTDDTLKIVLRNTQPPSISSKYHGYLASYGPTVIQTSLKQTILFYETKDDDKKQINELLKKTLAGAGLIDPSDTRGLHDIIEERLNGESLNKWKSLMFEAVTACKLAMRTFKKPETEAGHHDD
jgi:hypothetical protein